MGTDPATLSILLDILVERRVKRYESDPTSGGLLLEFHPPELPAAPNPIVLPADRGKIDQAAPTPYHRLFGGSVPAFRSSGEP